MEKKRLKSDVYPKFQNITKDRDLFLDKSTLFIFETVIHNQVYLATENYIKLKISHTTHFNSLIGGDK